MAKAPVPGQVKTRLCPPLTSVQAAKLAAAAIEDTVEAVVLSQASRRLVALDGRQWAAPEGVEILPQRPGPFGDRLAGAVMDAWSGLAVPVLVIGMDTPQLSAPRLDEAAAALGATDTVLGPAADGGYWVIGTRRPVPGMFDGVPMSAPGTGRAQHRRLERLGLSVATVGELRDVDEYDDALAVAGESPHTRFAAALSTMAPAYRPRHDVAVSPGGSHR